MRDSFPRLQMMLLVALTGGFGLLASFTLLHLGVSSMALRYPLALACAYTFFLFLIWLWLRTNAQDYLDAPDLTDLLPEAAPSLGQMRSGGGGDFGGGGASARFDAPLDPPAVSSGDGGSSLGLAKDAADAVTDADEFTIPLVVIALAVGIAVASLYVVYIAPVLFSEVLLDGALSYVLLRRLRKQDRRHWITSAFRRTVWPFIGTALFLMVVGAAMSAYAPGARSLGQVMHYSATHR